MGRKSWMENRGKDDKEKHLDGLLVLRHRDVHSRLILLCPHPPILPPLILLYYCFLSLSLYSVSPHPFHFSHNPTSISHAFSSLCFSQTPLLGIGHKIFWGTTCRISSLLSFSFPSNLSSSIFLPLILFLPVFTGILTVEMWTKSQYWSHILY